MTTLFFLGLIIAGAVFWFISTYNKLIQMIETVNNNKQQIDVQLDRRYKVFENLIEAVKKYMDYEQSTLKEVVALRNQAQQAAESGDDYSRITAEETISKIAGGINVIFERYPELKANKNALQLQEEIVNTENKLAFAKQAYNDSIQTYTQTKNQFMESMVVSIATDKLYREFAYWNVPEEKRQELEDYQVKF